MVNVTKNLTNPKGSQLSLMESVGTAIGKSVVIDGFVEPMAISPLTNDSKLLNGVVEVVGAGLVGGFLGSNIFGKSLSTAMMVSAGDNFASVLGLGSKPSGQSSQSSGSKNISQVGSSSFGESNLGNNTITDFI